MVFAARDHIPVIGTLASAPARDRRVVVDPGLLRYRDRPSAAPVSASSTAATSLGPTSSRRSSTVDARPPRSVCPPCTTSAISIALSCRRRPAGVHPWHSASRPRVVAALATGLSPGSGPVPSFSMRCTSSRPYAASPEPRRVTVARSSRSGSRSPWRPTSCRASAPTVSWRWRRRQDWPCSVSRSTREPSPARRPATSLPATRTRPVAALAGASSSWPRRERVSTLWPASVGAIAASAASAAGSGRSPSPDSPRPAWRREWLHCSRVADGRRSPRSSSTRLAADARRPSVRTPGSRRWELAVMRKPMRRFVESAAREARAR